MSSAIVLASAPPAPQSETQHLYQSLPTQDNFRLQKINEIATTVNHEVAHYRLVAKKYKKRELSLIGVLQKIKREIRNEVREEFKKRLAADSKPDLRK